MTEWIFNRSGDVFMGRWAGLSLVQVMACRLFGAITSANADLLWIRPLIINFNNIQMKFRRVFFHENVFEIAICKTSAILSGPQCVNSNKNYKWYFHFYNVDTLTMHGQSICLPLCWPQVGTIKYSYHFDVCWFWIAFNNQHTVSFTGQRAFKEFLFCCSIKSGQNMDIEQFLS